MLKFKWHGGCIKSLYKYFGFSIAVVLLVICIPAKALAFIIVYGNGSSEKPYRISTCAQLHSYLNDIPGTQINNLKFVLTNNLDCTGLTFNNTNILTGVTIDGANHKITNITIGEYGFVYLMDSSTIKNLWFESGNNTGAPYFYGGSFANQMTNGSALINVRSSLNLNCDGFCGGLVGISRDSTISQSVYDGTLNAGSYSGGLVGSDLVNGTTNTTITKSAFLGTMTAPSYSGGIFGSYVSNSAVINSYAEGIFDLGPYSGGIIGSFNNAVAIDKAYSAGTGVFSSSGGGILGGNSNSDILVVNSYTLLNSNNLNPNIGNVEGSFNTNTNYAETYYLDESGSGRCRASNASSVSGCNSMSISTADTIAQYLGWDTNTIWQKELGKNPTLRLPDFADPAGIPNNGDMNNDGVLDTFQGNVELLKNQDNQWVAIETKDSNACTIGDANLTNSTDAPRFEGYSFQSNLINFSVYCPSPGQSFTTNIYFDTAIDTAQSELLFYNPSSNQYSKINNASFSKQIIGGKIFTVASYTLADGGPLDRNGAVDGYIQDPIILAQKQNNIAYNVPNTGLERKTGSQHAWNNMSLLIILSIVILKESFFVTQIYFNK